MRKTVGLLFVLLCGCSSAVTQVEEPVKNPQSNFELRMIEEVSKISDADVYTFTCELIAQKPSESTPNCADFGEAVFDITWDSWSAEGAKGRGRYSINDCDPDCASGTRHETDVKVRLDNLYTDGKRYFLRDFTFESEKAVMPGRSKTGGWDTAEFYLEVPDMRSDG